jgi:hypothetical protein
VRAIIPGRHKTDDATAAMIWAAESLKSLPGQRSTTDDTVEAHLRQLIEGRVYGKQAERRISISLTDGSFHLAVYNGLTRGGQGI